MYNLVESSLFLKQKTLYNENHLYGKLEIQTANMTGQGQKKTILEIKEKINLQNESTAYFPSSTVFKLCKTYTAYTYRAL